MSNNHGYLEYDTSSGLNDEIKKKRKREKFLIVQGFSFFSLYTDVYYSVLNVVISCSSLVRLYSLYLSLSSLFVTCSLLIMKQAVAVKSAYLH